MTDDREPLPPDWTTLAPLLDRVLDAGPGRREAVLDEVSAGDARLRAALARLVAECDQGTPLLDRPAAERFGALSDEAALVSPRFLAVITRRVASWAAEAWRPCISRAIPSTVVTWP